MMESIQSIGNRSSLFIILLIFTLPGHSTTSILTNRYQTTSIKPLKEQINPLLAVSEFKFPSQVNTVGDALEIVLHQTGYSLVDEQKQSKNVRLTLKKPLPVTVRSLGPITIANALTVLMGHKVFQLVEDPLNRKVDFKIRNEFAKKIGAKNAFRKS